MLNIEHIICEYADQRNMPYGKAEGLFLGKLKIACKKGGWDIEDIMKRIEGLDADKVAMFAEAVATGKPPVEIFKEIPKNSVDSPVDKDYKGTIKNNQSPNGGPKMKEDKITTKDMLIELNECRVALGQKPLKAWKESRAKLEDTINMLHNELDERADTNPEPEKHPDPVAVAKDAKKMAAQKEKSIKGKAAAAPKKSKPAPNATNVTIGQLCEQLSINPKVARAKLRRLVAKDETFPKPVSDGRWEWDAKHKDALIKLLS